MILAKREKHTVQRNKNSINNLRMHVVNLSVVSFLTIKSLSILGCYACCFHLFYLFELLNIF